MTVPDEFAGLSSRLDFSTWLEETERLLQLQTALPALSLVAERAVMRDAVNQGFELVVDCLSTSAHFELKKLVGEQMTLHVRQADGVRPR